MNRVGALNEQLEISLIEPVASGGRFSCAINW